MDSNPRVSIVIPVYNGSNYLREAIDSTLAQTYENLEVIVVNDGSSDGGKTAAIAQSYGERIRYFYKPNGGVSSALNLGIREMTGDWFSWLSHDDYYYPEKVEKQIGLVSGQPDIRVTFCNTGVMDEAGRTISEHNPSCTPVLRGGKCFWDIWIYACSLLVHKSCFDVIGMFDESNMTTQDTEFTLLLLHHFDVHHLHRTLVKRRDHRECGVYLRRRLNRRERDSLMHRLLDEYGIGFFFPDLSPACDDRQLVASAYEKLGDVALVPQDATFSSRCYRASLRLRRSPLNTALCKLILGGSVLWRLKRVKGRLLRVVKGAMVAWRTLCGNPLTHWPGLLRNLWVEYRERRRRG